MAAEPKRGGRRRGDGPTAPNPRRSAAAFERPGELDRLIHEPARLGIVSALAAGEWLSFTGLKGTLRLTDGNLSIHARKLEEAGYVECRKEFRRRRPLTRYRLTPKGRDALQRYLSHMEAILEAARTTD